MYLPEIDFTGVAVYPPGSSYGPLPARAHELVWLEEGSAVANCGELTASMRPGSVVLSPKGTLTQYVWDTRVTTRHGFLSFRAPNVEQVCVDLPTGDVVPALLRHVVHLDMTRPDGWYADAQQALNVALRALAVPRASAERLLSPVVLDSLAAVRRRWPYEGPWPALTLAEMAVEAAVTPEYLCRAWTKDVGLSPVGALTTIRLYRAAFLLSRSNIAVADVARVAGFDNPYHFTRAFKRIMGASPTAFRAGRVPPAEATAGIRAVMSHL